MKNIDIFAEFGRLLVSQTLKSTRPFVVGVSGCQGSGKSTLAKFLADYINDNFLLNVVVLSLDDFYLSKAHRFQKAQSVHPLFKTRGVPGTHDIKRLTSVLYSIKHCKVPITIPAFDKGKDDIKPRSAWQVVEAVPDIVIVEGWCWGITSQQEDDLFVPINQLEVKFDPQCIWRKHINEVITSDYVPLYDNVDYWLFLQAPDFNVVKQWRNEQEQPLLAQGSSAAMPLAEIEQFVQHFQRLTEHALVTLPQRAHRVWRLDHSRHIVEVMQK